MAEIKSGCAAAIITSRFDTQICLYFQYDWAVNIMCEPAFWLLLCAWTAPASGEVQSKVTCLALDPLLLIPSPDAASLKAGGRWVEVHQVWWSIAHLGSVLDRPHLILVAMRTRMELRIVPHQAQVQAKELSNGILIGKYLQGGIPTSLGYAKCNVVKRANRATFTKYWPNKKGGIWNFDPIKRGKICILTQ